MWQWAAKRGGWSIIEWAVEVGYHFVLICGEGYLETDEARLITTTGLTYLCETNITPI
jgi:hypothetical protein